MRKFLSTLLTFLFPFISAHSQDNIKLTQFFQAPQMYNPAFSGVEPFLDIKVGRKQNLGAFEYAPKTSFISLNAPINASKANSIQQYSLRISNPDLYAPLQKSSFRLLKHGLGGIYVNENQDAFTQQRLQFSYALHFALNDNMRISAALSPFFFSNRVDADRKFEINPDPIFSENSSLTYSRLGVNAGILLYSSGFYVGYSTVDLYKRNLSVRETMSSDSLSFKYRMSHILMGGVNFSLNERFEILPGIMIRYSSSLPVIYNINTKFRMDKRYWAGLSYQTSGSLSLIAGAVVNDWLNISYSYDHTIKGISNYISGSHELVLGIMLFGNNFGKPFLW